MSNNKKSIFEFPSVDDTFVWLMTYNNAIQACYASAMKSMVFDIVKEHQPINRSDLIEKAKYKKRAGEAVINVVTALGLLKCINGNYYLTEISDNYLSKDSVFSWHSILNFKLFTDGIEFFMKAIYAEEEKENLKNWESGEYDNQLALNFTAFMQSSQGPASIGFAKKVDLEKRFGVKSFMDVGAGSGCFCASVVHHQPNIKAVIFELEPVCRIAQSYVDKYELPKDSIVTFAGDMFKDNYPSNNHPKFGYQAIFYSNIFHDWNDEKCRYLAKKSYDALPENGVILLHEALLNEDGNGPLITACFDFTMFLGTQGKQFTFTELNELLTSVGFRDIGVIPTYGIFSIVYARK